MRRVYDALKTLPLAAAVAAMLSSPAAAQSWPARPVTLVVPFAAGGSTDGVARVIAKELGDKLGQNFLVENRGGAAGNVAGAAVAKAPPDGYTLLLATTGPAAVNKLLYKSLSFDPGKDFTPIVLIGIVPQAIVVAPRMPVSTLKELIDYAKARPGKLNFGNSGVGTMAHISAVSLARATGIEVTHVTYRGGAQAMTDVIGGQIDVSFPAYVPSVAAPNVPTVRETGVADIVAGSWFCIVAPAGVSGDVVQKINKVVNDFLKSKRAIDLFNDLGVTSLGGSPDDLKKYMAEETARWAPIVKAAHIVLE
jgi:tripartite-type tricarboxylate transporter receptor subunit TctC